MHVCGYQLMINIATFSSLLWVLSQHVYIVHNYMVVKSLIEINTLKTA